MSVVQKQQDKFKDYISLKQLLFSVKNTFQLGLKCLLMTVPGAVSHQMLVQVCGFSLILQTFSYFYIRKLLNENHRSSSSHNPKRE